MSESSSLADRMSDHAVDARVHGRRTTTTTTQSHNVANTTTNNDDDDDDDVAVHFVRSFDYGHEDRGMVTVTVTENGGHGKPTNSVGRFLWLSLAERCARRQLSWKRGASSPTAVAFGIGLRSR